jgi:superfamily II DNA or RNA helicase
MNSSVLSEAYRKAFAKRLQGRAAGVTEKPEGLGKEENEGYNDADIAFNMKNAVNEKLKTKSAKYRKAYHERIYNAVHGIPNTPPSSNAEIEEARRYANAAIQDPYQFFNDGQRLLALAAEMEMEKYKQTYDEAIRKLERGEELELNMNSGPEVLQAQENAERDFYKRGKPSAAVVPTPVAVVAPEVPAVVAEDCERLYDPCTKEPIEGLDVLEKRVRELKQKHVSKLNIRVDLPSEIVTRLDLLLMILNNKSQPDESLLQYKLGGQTGQIFEAYWDIVFSLGLLSKYPVNENFYMYNGNIDGISTMEDVKLVQNAMLYLESRNVNMGASGASDITFVYKNNKEDIVSDPCSHTTLTTSRKPKFVFCSSKFYKDDKSKSVDKYDIQNIYTSAKNLHTDYDCDIVLLVQNPTAVKGKIKTAIRQYISEEASEVFGIDDLLSSLRKLYDFVHKKNLTKDALTKEYLRLIMGIDKPVKPILSLRLHQDIAVQKITNGVKQFQNTGGRSNKFLVGILPRGGKTYIAGGIVRELNPSRVVVLLGAKSETLEQFKESLFEYFQDFHDYEVLDVKEETPSFDLDLAKKYIFIMSVELYKTQSTTRKLLVDLKSEGINKADLFICDEGHLKQVTARADLEMQKGTTVQEEKNLQAIDSILTKSIPVVYMTGTYLRPLSAFKIPPENVVIWDYEDLQNGKKLAENDSYFRELYGDLYSKSLEKLFSYGETLDSISAVYKKFPDLHLLTTQFTEEAKRAFSDEGAGKGFAKIEQVFRLKKGFNVRSTEPVTWANGFQNLKGVLRLINYLAPPETAIRRVNEEEIEDVGSVIRSIDKISQRVGDRLAFFSTDFVVHTQIWFLAHSQSDLLQNRMPAFASAIFRNAWFRKHFHVLAVSGVNWREVFGKTKIEVPAPDDPSSAGTLIFNCPNTRESLKQCILREEAEARRQNKGLIILAQNMLQVGISLACADVVVLLDTGENVDDRIQKMFRALTESPMKKGGYIVDMNYFRTVKAVMDYQISSLKVKKNKRAISRQDSLELFNKFMDLYYIDDDKKVLRTDIAATIPEIQSLIEREGVGDMKIENAGRIVNTNIRDVLDSEYSKIYDEFLGFVASEKEKKRLLREEGKEVERAEDESDSNENETETNAPPALPKLFNNAMTEPQKKEAFLDIFQVILKMGIFTTNTSSIQELSSYIRDNEEFRQTIYETLVNRGDILMPTTAEEMETQKKLLFDFIILPNLQKIVDKGREGSYADMKGHFNRSENMQGRIDNVLKYINEHLAPKDKERHKFGEVFTPLSLVDEMLSKLPADVWSNPDLKWLDPANGMGNFPIKAFLGQDQGEFKYPGLYEGLRASIKDDDKRCKHIVENMLYMIDINGKNNRVARMLFEKLCPNAIPNIEQIDKKNGFLTEKSLIFNGKAIETFDIVMGNPPYQGGAIRAMSTKKTRKQRDDQGFTQDKHKNLWIPFVQKSLELLNKKGFLVFITPIGWFKPGNTDIHEKMLTNQIHFIRIIFNTEAKRIFGGSGEINVAYFSLQKKEIDANTTIVDIYNNKEIMKLKPDSIISLAYNSIYNKVQQKGPLFKDSNDYRTKTILKTKCESGPNKQISRITDKGEIKFVSIKDTHADQSLPKIILSGAKFPRYYFDKDGEYGVIGNDQHYFVGNKLEKLAKFFDTKLSALLLANLKYRMKFIEPKFYPDIRDLPLTSITDETLAEYYGFTKGERDTISAIEYPKREYNFKAITCAELKGQKEEGEEAVGGARNKTRKAERST